MAAPWAAHARGGPSCSTVPHDRDEEDEPVHDDAASRGAHPLVPLTPTTPSSTAEVRGAAPC